MFNNLTHQAILIKLFEMLSKANEPGYNQSAPLGFRESGARICAYRKSDASLCLSLEYDRGRRLDSQPVMRYHWGWQLAEDYITITQGWLHKVHKIEAPNA